MTHSPKCTNHPIAPNHPAGQARTTAAAGQRAKVITANGNGRSVVILTEGSDLVSGGDFLKRLEPGRVCVCVLTIYVLEGKVLHS